VNTISKLLLVTSLSFLSLSASSSPDKNSAQFIGSTQCANCHPQQTKAWQGSHHDLAMQHASIKTVLGDFDNKKFQYNNIVSTFFKKGEKFFVNTDGPKGTLQDFQIKYTFGVAPLQQYLIELPGGRLQALGIAWDTRTKEQGGQRWYHLYPDENVTYQDRLHWTRADQNWNYMCADCHSTHLQKNYKVENNTYETSWSEINVACEACHGPASDHVNWANKGTGWEQSEQTKGLSVSLNERSGVNWKINSKSGSAKRSKLKDTNKEIEICARCHSRRSKITNNYTHNKPLLDNYQPALLTDFLYYPDGQIKEEVYVYGSFVQSKMFHNGVTCSDCHEPHSLALRAEANGVCLQCHSAEKFNTKSHHFHNENSSGSSCAECHMPQSIYMGVDGRHDHSIRIPRPDLSLKLNTPNACNQCHKDKAPIWANQKMQNWYGKDWAPGWHFGETLYEARNQLPGAGQDLAAVAASIKLPSIARATAAEMLRDFPSRISFVVTQKLLKDEDDLVRLAALRTLDNLEAQYRLQSGFHLLSDTVLAIRIEAARIMSVIPRSMLSDLQQTRLNNAVAEYIQAQLANADRPEAHINIGLIYLRLQQFDAAEKAYKQSLTLEPEFVSAYVNLADLYRLQGQDSKAEIILKQGLDKIPKKSNQAADIHHALGLLYVREKQMKKALSSLSNAVILQPNNSRYAYVYAVALNSAGKTHKAITLLEKTYKTHPGYTENIIALISFYKQQGDLKSARVYAQKLLELRPDYGSVQQLIQSL